MAGALPISKDQDIKVKESFDTLRNRCLYVLGKCTGFRVSELLSIKIGQVYNKDFIKVARKIVKGNSESREVILNKEAKEAINDYLNSLEFIDTEAPLFVSRIGGGIKPLTRSMAHKIFKAAFQKAGLVGSYSTHSCRKSFSMMVYERSGMDLLLTQKALGHASILTTIKYLPVSQMKLNKIVLGDNE